MGFFAKIGKINVYSTKQGAKVSISKPSKKSKKK